MNIMLNINVDHLICGFLKYWFNDKPLNCHILLLDIK